MQRRLVIFVLIALFGMASLVCVGESRAGEKKWKNTITLPNGEVILDMNGEWDAFIENYGPWKDYGSYPQLVKVTQKGSSFVSVRMIDDKWHLKGEPAIQGDLNKEGFKNVYIMSSMGPLNAKGQISEDGNKIEIDDGEKARVTLIRK